MGQQTIPVLKTKFDDGKTPTGSDFGDVFDSFDHKSTKLAQSRILGLSEDLADKASKTDLANVVSGLNPMGDAQNLQDLATKPKRNNDAYFVLDQLDENGDPYIYRYDAELDQWINTKQVVYKDVVKKSELENFVNKADVANESGTATDKPISQDFATKQIAQIGRESQRTVTYTVASYDSSDMAKSTADYVAVNDNNGITQINNAINALPPNGGKIVLLAGTYKATSGTGIGFTKDNILIEGEGKSTVIVVAGAGANDYELYAPGTTVNCAIRNVAFNRVLRNAEDKVNSLRIDGCWVGGEYLVEGVKTQSQRTVTYTVASYDSSDVAKSTADYVATNENNGITQVNNAINALPDIGGKIVLLAGTYKATSGTGINFTKNNVIIEGEGKSTVITVVGTGTNDYEIYAPASTANCSIRDVAFNRVLRNANDKINSLRIDGCWVGGEYLESEELYRRRIGNPDIIASAYDSSYLDKALSSRIAASGTAGFELINLVISEVATKQLNKAFLCAGNYQTMEANGINLTNRSIELIGAGIDKTILHSLATIPEYTFYVPPSDTVRKRITKMTVDHVIRNSIPPTKSLVIDNCKVGNNIIKESVDDTKRYNLTVLRVGIGFEYATLSEAYNKITPNMASETNRFLIEIYGYIKETASLQIHKRWVDIVGHGACVDIEDLSVNSSNNGKDGIIIFDNETSGSVNNELYSTQYGAINDGIIKDIRFVRSGRFDGFNFGAISILSNHIRLYNVIGDNRSEPISSFDPTTAEHGASDPNGARRHGIVINTQYLGINCKTELHNCIGIGSPYGFENVRGIYVYAGSPKLYNCTGIGGGIGERCHGIMSHRYSKALFFNCVGIGSTTGYIENNGIQNQGMANSEFYNCVGYAGAGRASVGIGVWLNTQCKYTGCKGYSGNGSNSKGLDIKNNAKPRFDNCYFGVEDKTINIPFKADEGQFYQTFIIESETPISISNVSAWIVGEEPPLECKLYVETVEETPQIILNGVMANNNSLLSPTISQVDIPLNTAIKIYYTDSLGNMILIADKSVYLHIGYNYNRADSLAAELSSLIGAEFNECRFESANASDCLSILINSSIIDRSAIICRDTNKRAISPIADAKIFNSRINGPTDGVSFKNVTNKGSNYIIWE